MLQNFFCLMLSIVCLSNCKDTPKPQEEPLAEKESIPAVAGECYLSVIGKDSVLLQLVIENNSAAGQLHYRFFEKDKSGGTIFGNMKGDTLLADYKFISEGMESEREVVFIKQGDAFIEGTGELEDREGRVVFKDYSTVTFNGSPMQKTDCATLSWYFK